MKRIHVYLEQAEDAEKLKQSLHNKESAAVKVVFHPLTQRALQEIHEKEELAQMGLADWKDALYLTDIPKFADLLAAEGYPVMAYVHDKNRQASWANVQYIIMDSLEDVDMEYFLRVWQRLTGEPWHILDTERCSLRETTVADLDAFYEIYKEPSVTEYMENLFENKDEEEAYIRSYRRNIYEFYGFGIWTVILKETGQIIGRAGIDVREGYEYPELGFLIGVPWQGQGLAREVCKAVLDYAKEELEFRRVQAFVRPGNETSKRFLESLGFVYEKDEVLEGRAHLLYALECE